jgi:hypothetical protein
MPISKKASFRGRGLDSKEIAFQDRFRFEVGPPFVTTKKKPCLDILDKRHTLNSGQQLRWPSGRGDMMTPPAKFAAVIAAAMFGHQRSG